MIGYVTIAEYTQLYPTSLSLIRQNWHHPQILMQLRADQGIVNTIHRLYLNRKGPYLTI